MEQNTLKGIGLIVLAMTMIGYIDNFIRVIAGEAGLWQFHFVRGLSVLTLLVLIARVAGWRIMPRNPYRVALRSLFFSGSMVIYFGAAGVMPVSQAAAGMFTAPIFVLLISVVFLGTRIGIWRIVAVIVGFSGVVLILRPEAGGFNPLLLLPVLAGLLYGLGGISTRQWCEGETTGALMVGNFAGLASWGAVFLVLLWLFPPSKEMVETMPFFASGWVPMSETFLLWTGVQALGALVAVGMLTRGYQIAEVSFAAVAEFWFLVAAAFWSWMLWGEVPGLREALGIGAIIASGAIIAIRSK